MSVNSLLYQSEDKSWANLFVNSVVTKALETSDLVARDTTIGGDLDVTGTTTTNDLSVGGNAEVTGDLRVDGELILSRQAHTDLEFVILQPAYLNGQSITFKFSEVGGISVVEVPAFTFNFENTSRFLLQVKGDQDSIADYEYFKPDTDLSFPIAFRGGDIPAQAGDPSTAAEGFTAIMTLYAASNQIEFFRGYEVADDTGDITIHQVMYGVADNDLNKTGPIYPTSFSYLRNST